MPLDEHECVEIVENDIWELERDRGGIIFSHWRNEDGVSVDPLKVNRERGDVLGIFGPKRVYDGRFIDMYSEDIIHQSVTVG